MAQQNFYEEIFVSHFIDVCANLRLHPFQGEQQITNEIRTRLRERERHSDRQTPTFSPSDCDLSFSVNCNFEWN